MRVPFSKSWKALFTALFLVLIAAESPAQKKTIYPEDQLNQEEMAAHLRFIASDKLLGRMTGSPGNNEAARYIAGEFKKSGLGTFQSADGYFQRVPLLRRMPPAKSTIVLLGDSLSQPSKMALRSGGSLKWSGRFQYVGYGMVDSAKGIDEYKGVDVKGKVALTRFGQKGETNLFAALTNVAEAKRHAAQARGAVALVELYQGLREWKSIVTFFTRSGIETGPVAVGFSHFVVEDTSMAYALKAQAKSGGEIVLQTDGIRQEEMRAQNVIGFIRGSDPKLRDEYVLLTAHYDHIGVGKPEGPNADSIYNGARDNGMGTVALIAAAKSLAADPPKRSVIIAAVTGEELGMLGSRRLAAEPPVPMGKIVFDLNIDGAGYDDTTIVTVVGLDRTSAEPALKQGTERYGLTVMAEPVAQKGLFNQSDNVSFAARGVPAPTFSEGFHSFGPEIL
ncbi:MAG: M28 family peptidase, partial [Ignavibacteriales bacterium]|nr:M28 family peptidase [Ignavibacteriales bacterium]